MNYEDEIEEKVLNELKYKYNFDLDDIAYRYIILKFKLLNILNIKEEFFKEDVKLMDFIFKELNINKMLYNQQKIATYGFDNNFINILENWNFRYKSKKIIDEKEVSHSFDDYIDNMVKDIIKYSNKQSSFLKGKNYYNEINAYFRLKKLNEIFNIKDINKARKIDGFCYDENYDFYLSKEEELERYYHSVNFNTSSLNSITEEDFESYIYKHLNSIEEGLKPIERQYKIDNGRIDILAKDKDNNLVIIELKITVDKHLIWQVLYYPTALKKRVVGEYKDIRVITICPDYPDYIEIPLRAINGVELIKYKATISNKKIRKLEVQKI